MCVFVCVREKRISSSREYFRIPRECVVLGYCVDIVRHVVSINILKSMMMMMMMIE